jgi:hypothetical protein
MTTPIREKTPYKAKVIALLKLASSHRNTNFTAKLAASYCAYWRLCEEAQHRYPIYLKATFGI